MEGIRGTTHPLDTPLILECIFNKLDVSALKTCRQVNRCWHEAATLAMRPAVIVKFKSRRRSGSEDELLTFQPPSSATALMQSETGFNIDENIQIKQFLKLIWRQLSTFKTLPFANNFELKMIRVNCPISEFWAFCGNSIKSLHLSEISFDSAYLFRHIIFQSCPNLKNLTLAKIKVPGSANEGPSVWVKPRFPQNINLKRLELGQSIQLGSISYLELLSYFPSLEELEISTCENASSICQAVATCREHDPQSWNIKNISFNFCDLKEPGSDLRFLFYGRPSQETLNVRGVYGTEKISVFRNILSANATTLKSLSLEGDLRQIFDGSYETVLEKVVNLGLKYLHITSLQFLGYLPNLKRLEIVDGYISLESECSDEPLILNSCTELIIDMDVCVDEKDLLFSKVANVKKLKLKKCSNKLRAGICEILPNLVCLEVEDGEVDDRGISGLDEEN